MNRLFNLSTTGKRKALPLSVLLFVMLFMNSCSKEASVKSETSNTQSTMNKTSMLIPGDMLNNYSGLNATTLWELQQARAATARYRDIKNAKKDGYVDIDVVAQNMGHHFMKMSNVDDKFDFKSPEILVYNKMEDGSMLLVAVEYAVPLGLSAEAPEGFTGSHDAWDKNFGFGLWLLHAWVWYHNPVGVFNPTNPLVHTH